MPDSIFLYEMPRGHIQVAKQRPTDGFVARLDEQPDIREVLYLSPSEVGPDGWEQRALELYAATARRHLLWILDDRDLQRVSAEIYTYSREFPRTDIDVGRGRSKKFDAKEYLASWTTSSHAWWIDFNQGQHGYFYPGAGGYENLWRIVNIDTSLGNRLRFTLGRGPATEILASSKPEPTKSSSEPQPAAPKNIRVFLCHSSDDKGVVRQLYQRLEDDGIQPWLDERRLLPGQDWDFEIRKAIRESHAVIICLSKRSVRKEGYLQKEIKRALDTADEKPEGTIFVIPVRLDECALPERLRRWHWVDLFEGNGYEKLSKALRLRHVSLFGEGQESAPQPAPQNQDPESSKSIVPDAGDRFTMSGDFRGANVNIKSSLASSLQAVSDESVARSQRALLEIVFERKHPMWWPEEYWYRIGLHSCGAAPAENVEVRLKSMVPNPLEFNVLPSPLGQKGENERPCRINPSDTKYFDVARAVPNTSKTQLWTTEAQGQEFTLERCLNNESQLLIHATASNADLVSRTFLLRWDPGKELEFRPIVGC